MENVNKNRLFIASCVALLVTAMTFAIRARLETVFGPEGVGLTLEQIGWAFTPAFWGFTLAMIIGGPLVDSLGIKKITWIAFITHAIGITWTILAKDQTSLFTATLFVGIGNGMVEAALNPMIASMYTENKTKMLNRFHVWFPGGIAIGGVLGWLIMDVMGLGWQIMVGILFIPLVIYAFLFFGQKFPVTERVQLGVSNKKMIASLGKPLFIFMVLCMLLTAASELGTTQRIESLLKESGTVPLLVLVFINGIMATGRAFAGQVIHKLQPAGMLLFFCHIHIHRFMVVDHYNRNNDVCRCGGLCGWSYFFLANHVGLCCRIFARNRSTGAVNYGRSRDVVCFYRFAFYGKIDG